jgi:hypothetical protein
VAAGIWAASQPLDKLVFSSAYDDVELLGRAPVRGGRGWSAAGLAIHLADGALCGAVYAGVAHRIPVPARLRGPLLGLLEHFALWPLTAATDRFHPARERLPSLIGNRAAFAQATWHHLLFGFVLGELERRVNPELQAAAPPSGTDYSSNGHGFFQNAVSGQPVG